MYPLCDARQILFLNKYAFTVMVTYFRILCIYYHEHKILCACSLSGTAKLYPHLLMGVNSSYFSTA